MKRSTRASTSTRSSAKIERKNDKMKKQNKIKIPKSSLVVKHKDYLNLLSKSKDKNRRNKLIDAANNNEIRAISECVMNIIEGNVHISKPQLKQLKQHKKVLRLIAKRCSSTKQKRSALKQKGGFLPALLPMALKALGGLFLPMLFNK